MRVSMITAEYPPRQGGVGDYTAMLCRHLHRQGVETTVVTTKLPAAADSSPPASRVIRSWGWLSWPALEAACGDADVIHIQYQTAAYGLHPAINLWPTWMRRHRRRPRLVVTFHDLRVPYLFPKAGRVRWWVTLALARGSDAVIVTNAADERRLRDSGLGARVHQIPLGNNIPVAPPEGYDRQAWRARLAVGEDEGLLVHFGFLNSSKGCETLIEAVAQLRQAGTPVRLLMVGGRTGHADPTNVAYAEQIEAQMASAGVAEAVIWTDFTAPDEVSGHLLAGDVAVLPYRDGVSFRRTTLITALAHGLPVVTTRPSPAIPALRDGENVALVPPDDAAALARSIARILSDDDMRRRLAEGARELGTTFDWNRIARQTAGLYGNLVGDREGGATGEYRIRNDER
ncbi:MAG: glycosyltransferase [Chloroflexi bacterium]|nr:glycosyltransferase [Chloroflexota bacterium]